jgi:transcription initiation factor TFIID subunit 5
MDPNYPRNRPVDRTTPVYNAYSSQIPQFYHPRTSQYTTGADADKVLEYLSKKGYVRTEAMLRRESDVPQDANGAPVVSKTAEVGGPKYTAAFELLKKYTDDNLEVYRPELRKLLWPVFVYSFLDLVGEYYARDAENFFAKFKPLFERDHDEDVKKLQAVRLPAHLKDSNTARIYMDNKYRVTMTQMPFYSLIQFLESKIDSGGETVTSIIKEHVNVVTVERTAHADKSIAAILARGNGEEELPAEDEGIPGHNPGNPKTDRDGGDQQSTLKVMFGQHPRDPDLHDDVRAELQDHDAKNPPGPGQNSLLDEYEAQIKREPTEDAPSRELIPLPPSLARDVSMEVQKIIEHRDRYKIEGRTGGVGPAVSVTMFTFHNTFDR